MLHESKQGCFYTALAETVTSRVFVLSLLKHKLNLQYFVPIITIHTNNVAQDIFLNNGN